MNILEDNSKQFPLALLLDRQEGRALILILNAALKGEKLNTRSNAYKLAKKLDDELPVF